MHSEWKEKAHLMARQGDFYTCPDGDGFTATTPQRVFNHMITAKCAKQALNKSLKALHDEGTASLRAGNKRAKRDSDSDSDSDNEIPPDVSFQKSVRVTC